MELPIQRVSAALAIRSGWFRAEIHADTASFASYSKLAVACNHAHPPVA
jgi:hypothetical protein